MRSKKQKRLPQKPLEQKLSEAELPHRVHIERHGDATVCGVSDHGVLVGQYHPMARYTDFDIDCVFAFRDSGMTIREIGAKLDMPPSTVHAVLHGRLRATPPTQWRRKKNG